MKTTQNGVAILVVATQSCKCILKSRMHIYPIHDTNSYHHVLPNDYGDTDSLLKDKRNWWLIAINAVFTKLTPHDTALIMAMVERIKWTGESVES